jgi:hypothetical protein
MVSCFQIQFFLEQILVDQAQKNHPLSELLICCCQLQLAAAWYARVWVFRQQQSLVEQ